MFACLHREEEVPTDDEVKCFDSSVNNNNKCNVLLPGDFVVRGLHWSFLDQVKYSI